VKLHGILHHKKDKNINFSQQKNSMHESSLGMIYGFNMFKEVCEQTPTKCSARVNK